MHNPNLPITNLSKPQSFWINIFLDLANPDQGVPSPADINYQLSVITSKYLKAPATIEICPEEIGIISNKQSCNTDIIVNDITFEDAVHFAAHTRAHFRVLDQEHSIWETFEVLVFVKISVDLPKEITAAA